MPIAVNTVKALTTLATLKTYLEITGTTKDELLSLLINSVSSFAESYCERQFNKQTGIIKQFDGNGTKWLYPDVLPIISISTIYDDVDRVFGADKLIASTDYIFYNSAIMLDGLVFTKGDKNIKLTYTAGYVLPNIVSPDLPADLEMAVIEHCAYLYNIKGKGGISSEKVGDVSFSYGSNSSDKTIPIEIKQVLNKYRRFVLW